MAHWPCCSQLWNAWRDLKLGSQSNTTGLHHRIYDATLWPLPSRATSKGSNKENSVREKEQNQLQRDENKKREAAQREDENKKKAEAKDEAQRLKDERVAAKAEAMSAWL